MSPLKITTNVLLQSSAITAICGDRIFEIFSPQSMKFPNIIVRLIHNEEEYLLQGGTQQPRARVSIECRARGDVNPMTADKLAEAVIDHLRDIARLPIFGIWATFQKEGSDETDSSEQTDEGNPYVIRRIVDFYVQIEQPVI